jgi:hypothetical protein
MLQMANVFHALTRWLAGAAAGLVVTVLLAESVFALLTLFGNPEHLLWTLTQPTAAAGTRPALLAVVWLMASAAGSTLAATLSGHLSAALPAGLLPAASMVLMAWFFHQPAGMTATLAFGPLVGCLLGIVAGRTVRRRDQAESATVSTHGAEI